MDGDSVDDQKSSAPGRRVAQREEEEEMRKLRREEQEREQKEKQAQAHLDEEHDPNDFNYMAATRGSGTADSGFGGLGEDWEDYGEDDDD